MQSNFTIDFSIFEFVLVFIRKFEAEEAARKAAEEAAEEAARKAAEEAARKAFQPKVGDYLIIFFTYKEGKGFSSTTPSLNPNDTLTNKSGIEVCKVTSISPFAANSEANVYTISDQTLEDGKVVSNAQQGFYKGFKCNNGAFCSSINHVYVTGSYSSSAIQTALENRCKSYNDWSSKNTSTGIDTSGNFGGIGWTGWYYPSVTSAYLAGKKVV